MSLAITYEYPAPNVGLSGRETLLPLEGLALSLVGRGPSMPAVIRQAGAASLAHRALFAEFPYPLHPCPQSE